MYVKVQRKQALLHLRI